MANTFNSAIAYSAMNLATNTLIAVSAATSTFTSHALLYRSPPWKLNSTTTHWPPFWSRAHSLATFAAKKAKVCPFCVLHVFSGFIENVLFYQAESKLCVTGTSSASPILLFNSIHPTLDFVKSVLERWIHSMGFTIAPDVILLPTLIVLWKTRRT